MLLPPEEAQNTVGRTAELAQQIAVLLSISGPEVLLAERDTADSRRHGAPVRPCKQEACPLEQASPGR